MVPNHSEELLSKCIIDLFGYCKVNEYILKVGVLLQLLCIELPDLNLVQEFLMQCISAVIEYEH